MEMQHSTSKQPEGSETMQGSASKLREKMLAPENRKLTLTALIVWEIHSKSMLIVFRKLQFAKVNEN